MARGAAKSKAKTKKPPLRRFGKWMRRGVLSMILLVVGWVAAYAVITPPYLPYMSAEERRLGGVQHDWVSIDDIAPVMVRSVIAAEDANFCLHWGFDLAAIRAALADESGRGASTLTQQVVKNAYLWHGRSWWRKGAEAALTPLVEVFWSKQRIVEVYLNIAEFDEGVFGVAAAAKTAFGTTADKLTAVQAARLAMVLPNPKGRSARNPTKAQRRRSAAILDGAATIRKDGRAACLQS